MKKCGYTKRYLGRFKPKCNKGQGCDACNAKYLKKHTLLTAAGAVNTPCADHAVALDAMTAKDIADLVMKRTWLLPAKNAFERQHLPADGAARKGFPIATGVIDYFPDALMEISAVSKDGNDQHNPGTPLHWDKSKSSDEANTLIRHFLDRGKRDTCGHRHTAKVAWRALAMLQREIEEEQAKKASEDGLWG